MKCIGIVSVAVGGAAVLAFGAVVGIETLGYFQTRSSPSAHTAKPPTHDWEFEITKDAMTDRTSMSVHLYAESMSELMVIRCEGTYEINKTKVPVYDLQIATIDYLGETGWQETRVVTYRIGAEKAVSEEWAYSDRNAEQGSLLFVPADRQESEVQNRIAVAHKFIVAKTFKIRVKTFKSDYHDYTFEGRDPKGALTKLATECVK
ncbi:MAG TPA: hypothetical protein VMV19_20295 [Xanthobacteraceae bacterium]|nr:hypothetical protein [Xanthobacteraceae bacterium]